LIGPNGESYAEDKVEFLDFPEDCDWVGDAGAFWSPIFEKWYILDFHIVFLITLYFINLQFI
jgi:hypothetical protein